MWERRIGRGRQDTCHIRAFGSCKPFGAGEWEATKGVTHKVSVLFLREFILTGVCVGGRVGTDLAMRDAIPGSCLRMSLRSF